MEKEQNFPINYNAVLADLLNKEEMLKRTIEGIRTLINQTQPDFQSNSTDVIEVKTNDFFGLSVPEAIRKLMNLRKKPMNSKEIAHYLESGGFTHSSANFVNTVGSVLSRMSKNETDVVSIKRGQYGLIEWYSGYKRKNVKKEEHFNKTDDLSDLI